MSVYLRGRNRRLAEENRQLRLRIEQLEGDLETFGANAMRRFKQLEAQIEKEKNRTIHLNGVDMDTEKLVTQLTQMILQVIPEDLTNPDKKERYIENFIMSTISEKVIYMSQEPPVLCAHGDLTPNEGCIGCDICLELEELLED